MPKGIVKPLVERGAVGFFWVAGALMLKGFVKPCEAFGGGGSGRIF